MARRHGERKEYAARRKDRERRDLEEAIRAVDAGRASPSALRLYQRAVNSGVPLPQNTRYGRKSSSIRSGTSLLDAHTSTHNWVEDEFARKRAAGVGSLIAPTYRSEIDPTESESPLDEPAGESEEVSTRPRRPVWRKDPEAKIVFGEGDTYFDAGESEDVVHIDPWRSDEDFAAIRLAPFVRSLYDNVAYENLTGEVRKSSSNGHESNGMEVSFVGIGGDLDNLSVFVQEAAFVPPVIEARRFAGTHLEKRSTEPRPHEEVVPWDPHRLAGVLRPKPEITEISRPIDDLLGRVHSGRKEMR